MNGPTVTSYEEHDRHKWTCTVRRLALCIDADNVMHYVRSKNLRGTHSTIVKDTVLSHKAINDVQDPLGMNCSLKHRQHVIVPDELAARCRKGTWVGPHLALEGKSEVVRIAEVEVA